jgi:integrase
VIDAGRDPETGRRKQRWIKFTPTHTKTCTTTSCSEKCTAHDDAKAELAKIRQQLERGTYIDDATKTTLIECLRDWIENSVKPTKRAETYRTYNNFVETHVAKSSIAQIALPKLRRSHIEHFYNVELAALAPASIAVVHTVLKCALDVAMDDKIVEFNAATRAKNRRRRDNDASTAIAQQHCWSASEAKAVLDYAAMHATPQLAAYVYLALDAGARKSELDALLWSDINLDTGEVSISKQLDHAGVTPIFGPTKNKRRRTIKIGAETIAMLRTHRQAQRELMMRNRSVYQDLDLVFAREPEDVLTSTHALGQPLAMLSESRFQTLVKNSHQRRIKFHGCRHTVATLSLQSGTPAHDVAARLGHTITELMRTYAHSLPNAQQDAAARLRSVLHG